MAQAGGALVRRAKQAGRSKRGIAPVSYQNTKLIVVVIWVQSLPVRQAIDQALAAWAQF